MNTFCVQTLGCKVNHYESEQIAALLRSRGLVETDAARADLRVVNTCSVTVEASGKSRQTTRRLVRLPLLTAPSPATEPTGSQAACRPAACQTGVGGLSVVRELSAGDEKPLLEAGNGSSTQPSDPRGRARVVVTGCWATSEPAAAAALPGVDAVLTHHGDVAAELDRLLLLWGTGGTQDDRLKTDDRSTTDRYPNATPDDRHTDPTRAGAPITLTAELPPEPLGNEGWMIEAGSPAGARTSARTPSSKAESIGKVNAELVPGGFRIGSGRRPPGGAGTTRLPLLGDRQTGRQRAVLKIQDGCDAHCTYCIIPKLRPVPWSKPLAEVVEEARRLVDAGHVEIVLTGIFLGAYGQPTALRRRQPIGGPGPLGALVGALCDGVPGLRRLRLSSLEPGDLTDGLVAVLRSCSQVVPHFHLPLQSGSETLLRKMNRQYGRDDFLRMIDRVRVAFDRPALTTDIIVGFPGETDSEFLRTLEVVDHAGFIHVHAFPYSPRPGTAAARWGGQFVPGPVANERIATLRRRAEDQSLAFRRQFIGQTVELLVERESGDAAPDVRHGRCERYFDVHFRHDGAVPGDLLRVRVDRVTADRTEGTCVGAPAASPAGGEPA